MSDNLHDQRGPVVDNARTFGMVLLEPLAVDGTRLRRCPYVDSPEFDEDWWQVGDLVHESDGEILRYQALLDGVEVGRLELSEAPEPDDDYGIDLNGVHFLKVWFIEVGVSFRRQGLATNMVKSIIREHPDSTLLAYSEGGDDFWASVGWKRVEHPEGTRLHYPLYVFTPLIA